MAASVRDTGMPLRGLLVGFAIAIGVAALGLVLSSRLRVAARPSGVASPVPATGP